MAIALDPAASSFYENGAYDLTKSGQGRKTTDEMIALYQSWLDAFPIVSIEDGLDENDWAKILRARPPCKADARRCWRRHLRHEPRLRPAWRRRAGGQCVLIKLNQIGTVSETVQAIALCREAGWRYVISHRSGGNGRHIPR